MSADHVSLISNSFAADTEEPLNWLAERDFVAALIHALIVLVAQQRDLYHTCRVRFQLPRNSYAQIYWHLK